MNSKKKSIVSSPALLVLFGFLILKILTQELVIFHTKYLEIIYLFGLVSFLGFLYSRYKNTYRNLSLFFVLTFLLFGFLPYCHYLAYSSKSDNYNFSEEYLKNNIKLYKSNLEDYKDSVSVKELFSQLKQNKIDETLYDTIQSVGDFNLVFVKSHNSGAILPNKAFFIQSTLTTFIGSRPNDRENYNQVFITKKGEKKVIKLEMKFKDLKLVLANYIREKNEILKMINQPEKFVPFNDFWIDSVTGFTFSFIKPVSKISQIIRLTQLILAYFFLHMLTTLLKLSKEFEITKVKNGNC
ncbi:MAG: hypothetical protein JST78_13140 [Bacteroidetes bacterium]|nr:hypothetical protein [Bacteroidota bacterium]